MTTSPAIVSSAKTMRMGALVLYLSPIQETMTISTQAITYGGATSSCEAASENPMPRRMMGRK